MNTVLQFKNTKDETETFSEMLEIIEKLKVDTGQSSYIIPMFPRNLYMDRYRVKRNPINRDEERRLPKVSFLKDHNPTHDEIALFVVRESITIKTKNGEEYDIEPGVYLGNGNTRRLWYEQNPNYTPKTENLTARVHEITNGDDYQLIYHCYDSDDAVEKSAEKIQGALNLMKVNVNSTKARSGAFGSALSMAYGDWKASAIDRVSNFKDEIELIDKHGIFDPVDKTLGFQTMIATALIAAKHWGQPDMTRERMISGLQFLANAKQDNMSYGDNKWDGLTAICYEVFNPGQKGWIPEGMIGSTKGVTQAPQLDFFLYCFEKYMLKQKLDKTKGFQRSNWEGKWKTIAQAIEKSLI